MVISDWIDLVAAILVGGGTLFLAVMTVKSIRQTNKLRKEEKIQRELNEISQWAADITEMPSQVTFELWPEIFNMKEPKRSQANEMIQRKRAGDTWLRYNSLCGRRERIRILALNFTQYKLDKMVRRVSQSLNDVMSLLEKRGSGEISNKDTIESGDLLHKRADTLVRVASWIEHKAIR